MFSLSLPFPDISSTHTLREWRVRVLDGVLRGILTIWVFGLVSGINNVIKAYHQDGNENSLVLAISIASFYTITTILTIFITFNHKIKYEYRAGVLLTILYTLGAVGLFFSSLGGDGRIFFFAFIVLSAIFLNRQYGLTALWISLFTLALIGWLQITEIVIVPPERQINSIDIGAWISGGIIFLTLSAATLMSITYLLHRLEQSLNQEHSKAAELTHLYAVAQDMAAGMLDTPALLKILARHVAEALDATSISINQVDYSNNSITVAAEYWSAAASVTERKSDLGRVYSLLDYPDSAKATQTGVSVCIHTDDDKISEQERQQLLEYGVKSALIVPLVTRGNLVGVIEVWESRYKRDFTPSEISLVFAMANHAASVIENARLFTALEQREAYFRALIENSAEGIAILDRQGNFRYIAPSEERLTGYLPEDAIGTSAFDHMHPEDLPHILKAFQENIEKPGVIVTLEYRFQRKDGVWRHYELTGQNLINDPNVAGVVVNFRDITERKSAEETLRRHADELETITAVSSALRAAMHVDEIIPILTRESAKIIGGAYGSIFLLDPENGELISHGWYAVKDQIQQLLPTESILRHKMGDGITGRVAQTGEIHITEDVSRDPLAIILPYEKERLRNVQSGISLPLRAQDRIVGVLHVWLTEKHTFHENEIRLLTATSEIAGNALHRAMLYEETLLHANELSKAYDNTLDGWARALELRDELTEGHTRRVTELTVQLARALGIPEPEVDHIRRGAFLHDIGKMAIPDSILKKTDAMTPNERKIMNLHPQHAFDMLSSIPFLRASLDIPLCHHERWDGTGYPRKLKGEQIPLAARIFTVVDVWDALTSDRPYRRAWSISKTRKYLQAQAGKHFDPQIAEKFLELLDTQTTDSNPA